MDGPKSFQLYLNVTSFTVETFYFRFLFNFIRDASESRNFMDFCSYLCSICLDKWTCFRQLNTAKYYSTFLHTYFMVRTNITNMVEVEGATGINTLLNVPLTNAICHYLQTLSSYPNVSKRNPYITNLSVVFGQASTTHHLTLSALPEMGSDRCCTSQL